MVSALRAWSLVQTAANAVKGDGATNPLASELAHPLEARQAFAGMPKAAALRQAPSGRWSVLAQGQHGALAARRSQWAASHQSPYPYLVAFHEP